ncbi:HlyD family secretion protein [Azospirillum lipoferum]|uniref:HlyD family efflux transporter periplasmic adaptor subunit n=1 Tax=Azospirillum lipoferum TaxID=193 RepID=A0A5A9GUQ6_AZOLI|nr:MULTISPECIES: HlyD family efflux transporter periplasmic adaptor subunit [Azospirillum]KAA0598211.1 HlyD family efflux transporter periplasmic adaptor subunit [Azospirillum lipoferum]MCP1609809.1 HlyD family secretion protein [Azospirillum lipoferum]MDW5534887.1 HlyD family efflux transporter periplasmic adaptor subunit [Azospirillum sp. NL1]
MSGFLGSILDGLAAIALAIGLPIAAGGAPPLAHGYIEGEYLRIAAPSAGMLESLSAVRGAQVAAGAPLFAIDRATARAERDRLAAALAQARAQRADLATGKRAQEVAVLTAQKARAEAALRYSTAELARQQELVARKVSSPDKLDQARAAFDRDRGQLAEAEAQLAVAALPARPEQLRAADEAVTQAEAALAQAERRLADLAPVAPVAALVEDTMYNPGEWVPSGSPVVSLLPPERVKLVLFVPETAMAGVTPGGTLSVHCDGCPSGLSARVTRIASRAEYTPPVIYSVGSREKLVFRVEARMETGPDRPLNPGLPVDVWPIDAGPAGPGQ